MKIKEYLDSNGMRYKFFAKKIGITYNTLWRYMKGYKASLFIAKRIEEITDGQVKVEDLR